MSLRRKLALAALTFVAFGALLEGLARVVLPADRFHAKHAAIIEVLGLPALNAAMEPDPELFWRLKDGLSGLRVAGEIDGHAIDFSVSTHGHLRSPALPEQKAAPRVLVLGDSCAFGVGVEDAETWPAQVEELLRARGVEVDVIDAGVPGYSSFQGLRFLEERGRALAPDVVVACFGFNDRDSWDGLCDLESARGRSPSVWSRLASSSRLVSGLRVLLRPERSGGARPRLEPEEFEAVSMRIASAARELGAAAVLAIWPHAEQVEARVVEHVGYQGITARVARDLELPLVDLVRAFVASGEPLFLDHVHANARGCRIAAEAVADAVAPLLAERSALGGSGCR